jgi:hypothetical protein
MRLLCIWKAERPFQERTKTEKAQCEISSKTPFFVLYEAILKTTLTQRLLIAKRRDRLEANHRSFIILGG